MSAVYMLVYSVFAFAFAWLVFKIGQAMFKITSVKAAIEHFEVNPSNGSAIEKYFYGWIFPINRRIMKSLSAGSGDKLITAWYKISGVIFMLFAAFFVAGTLFMWVAGITGQS